MGDFLSFPDDAVEWQKLGIKIQYSSSRPQLNQYIYLKEICSFVLKFEVSAKLCLVLYDWAIPFNIRNHPIKVL